MAYIVEEAFRDTGCYLWKEKNGTLKIWEQGDSNLSNQLEEFTGINQHFNCSQLRGKSQTGNCNHLNLWFGKMKCHLFVD